jgi:hypothetical protein
MQIRTLQASEYRGCKIYYRQIGTVFEYLAVVKGQLYTTHIVIRRTPWQVLTGKGASKKEDIDIVNFLAKYAETTVDYALDGEK